MKKADRTTKKAETNTVSDNIERPPAAKKSPALGGTTVVNAGSKAGNKKAGNQDSKRAHVLPFFKRVKHPVVILRSLTFWTLIVSKFVK